MYGAKVGTLPTRTHKSRETSMPFINESLDEGRKRFRFLGWTVTRFTVKQNIIGTWPTPLGRVWQWNNVRFLVRRG